MDRDRDMNRTGYNKTRHQNRNTDGHWYRDLHGDRDRNKTMDWRLGRHRRKHRIEVRLGRELEVWSGRKLQRLLGDKLK